MGEVDNLQKQADGYRSDISNANNTIAQIDEKLKRLEAAKKTVGGIQKSVHTILDSLSKKDLTHDWKGEKEKAFSRYRNGQFNTSSKSFQQEVDHYYDDICDEITRLENQKHNETNFIGQCQSFLNSIGNEIEKLIHGENG